MTTDELKERGMRILLLGGRDWPLKELLEMSLSELEKCRTRYEELRQYARSLESRTEAIASRVTPARGG